MEPWLQEAIGLARFWHGYGAVLSFWSGLAETRLQAHRRIMRPGTPSLASDEACAAAIQEARKAIDNKNRLVNDADRVLLLNYHFQAWSLLFDEMGPHRPRGDHWPAVGLTFIENYMLYPDNFFYNPYGRAMLDESLARFPEPQFAIAPPRPFGMCDQLTLVVSGFFSVNRLSFAPPSKTWEEGRCWDDVQNHRRRDD